MSSSITNPNTNPSVDDVEGYNTDQLIDYLRGTKNLNLTDVEFKVFRAQRVDGCAFVNLTESWLDKWEILGGPTIKLMRLINKLNSQSKFYHKIVYRLYASRVNRPLLQYLLNTFFLFFRASKFR